MFDVFLSHNRKDKRAVRRLADALRKRQESVWLDVEQLEPGGDWQKGLEDGLRSSKTVAVLVGKDGLGPSQVEEVKAVSQLAVGHKKKLIPVLLPKACKKPRLPLFIANRNWLNLRRGISIEGIDKPIWGITAGMGNWPTPKRPPKAGERERPRVLFSMRKDVPCAHDRSSSKSSRR